MPSVGSSAAATVSDLLHAAKCRWLKGYEVMCLLENFHAAGVELSSSPVSNPPSGSLFFFHKKTKFRNDGIQWKRQKRGNTVRESHEKLKVGNAYALTCCYATCDDRPSLHRRCYWQLPPDGRDSPVSAADGAGAAAAVGGGGGGAPLVVLVHYLDEVVAASLAASSAPSAAPAAVLPPPPPHLSPISPSSPPPVAAAAPSHRPDFVRRVVPASSDARTSRTPLLLVDDKSSLEHLLPSPLPLRFVSDGPGATSFDGSSILWPVVAVECDSSSNSSSVVLGDDYYSISPPALGDTAMSLSPADSSPRSDSGCASPSAFPYGNPLDSLMLAEVDPFDMTLLHDAAAGRPQVPVPVPHTHVQQQPLQRPQQPQLQPIGDYSPDWDYLEGGAKLLITAAHFQPYDGLLEYFCVFDHVHVPATLVLPGVLRCHVPARSVEGVVGLYVALGNGMMFSELQRFEYRRRPDEPAAAIGLLQRVEMLERHLFVQPQHQHKTSGAGAFELSQQPAGPGMPLFSSSLTDRLAKLETALTALALERDRQLLADEHVQRTLADLKVSEQNEIRQSLKECLSDESADGKMDTCEAARRIARYYKTYRERFRRKLEAATIKVQTRLRMKLAMRQMREKRRKENEAAQKIQAAFKRYHSRDVTL